MLRKGLLAVVTGAVLFSSSLTAGEFMDTEKFAATATEVIRESMKGEGADTQKMLQQLEQLIEMGIASSKAYAAATPEFNKMLTLVVDQAEAMQSMSLDQIEEEWHEFGYLSRNGIDAESIEHFGPAISLMDSIVHPATSVIAIRTYQQDKDDEYLEQVKAELSEVLEHLKHINARH